MSKAQKQVEYEVEVDNVMALVVQLIGDLKAGKSLPEIGADVLPKLGSAISSVGGVAGDFSEDRHEALETVGFHLGDIVDALLGSQAAPAAPTPPAA